MTPSLLDAPSVPDVRTGRHTRPGAVQRTLLVIFTLNLVVLSVKLAVGIRSGSLAVLGAALESALDSLNNVVAIALVRVAGRAPDDDHPYGHDKFEALGAVAIVCFLSISCFELVREGIQQLMHRGAPASGTTLEMGLVAATASINVFVVWYERRRGRELRSALLLADAAHTSADLYVTLLAFASLWLTRFGSSWIDPALALVVAAVIGWSGYRIVREIVPILVDERGVDAERLRSVISAVGNVADVRTVRSRGTPSGVIFAEVTVGVDGRTSVADAHSIADEVERRITAELGDAEVTVHVEPA